MRATSRALDQGPEPGATRTSDAVTLRVITVKQPWAWAIVHGGKAVENRGRREPWHTAIGERIAIHAGKSRDDDGCYDPLVRAVFQAADQERQAFVNVEGAILGTALLSSVHHASQCRLSCSAWAQPDQWHLVLDDVQAWDEPVPARGALGLWTFQKGGEDRG